MGVSINSTEVERMIRDLAARRRVPMTEALRQPLVEEEARAAADLAARRRRIAETIARTADLPPPADAGDGPR
jgi:hypothetical protein